MAKAILLDNERIVVTKGNKLVAGTMAELEQVITEPTDVGVVPTELLRLVATSEDGLHRQVSERLPQGSVYCWEKVDTAVYQVFVMPEAMLQGLRTCKRVRAVVPYAILAREGQKAALPAGTFSQIVTGGLITRAGRAFLGPDSTEGPTVGTSATSTTTTAAAKKNEVMVVDSLLDRFAIVAIQGTEIKAVRALFPEDDLQREVAITLQGLNMPNCPIYTSARKVADLLSSGGRDANAVRLPPDVPAIGLHGFRKVPAVQFYLANELARERRRQVRRRELRSVTMMGVLLVVAVGLAGLATARRMVAEHELAALRQQQLQTSDQHSALFRERYASLLTRRSFDLPQAWVELEFMMPPQLAVQHVSATPEGMVAILARRETPIDQRDPPITLKEIRAAVARSGSWRGATVSMIIETQDFLYKLEKMREPASP